MTKEDAVRLYNDRWWVGKSPIEIAIFQLSAEFMCIPFGLFCIAVENALGRPVWTHEYCDPGALLAELSMITHDTKDRAYKLCKCQRCGTEAVCLPNFDFYTKTNDKSPKPLYCGPCFYASTD